jgi:hypothetical protein
VWSRYVGGQLTRVRADAAVRRENDRRRDTAARRARGEVPRDVYLAEVQRRRTAANTLRGLGVAVGEIAHRLGASLRSVHRWIFEIRCVPSPSVLSDFERPRLPNPGHNLSMVLSVTSNEVVEAALETARAASERSEASTEVSTQSTFGTNGTDDQRPNDRGRGVWGETHPESPMAYIQRRIREITSGQHLRPP